MLIFNTNYIFWHSYLRGRPAERREGYGGGHFDLKTAHAVGNLRWSSSTAFSEHELLELHGVGTRAGLDLLTTFENWVLVSIAHSAILIISSFWESFQVEPDAPAVIFNKGEQWLLGFHSACNAEWDLLRDLCRGKNNWWKEMKKSETDKINSRLRSEK